MFCNCLEEMAFIGHIFSFIKGMRIEPTYATFRILFLISIAKLYKTGASCYREVAGI